MPGEGSVSSTSEAALRSEMLDRLRALGIATADDWERAVFRSLTGHDRDDVDWDHEDNQAGYYTWVKAFDRFIAELVEDGFVRPVERDGERYFEPVETDPALDWSPRADGP